MFLLHSTNPMKDQTNKQLIPLFPTGLWGTKTTKTSVFHTVELGDMNHHYEEGQGGYFYVCPIVLLLLFNDPLDSQLGTILEERLALLSAFYFPHKCISLPF